MQKTDDSGPHPALSCRFDVLELGCELLSFLLGALQLCLQWQVAKHSSATMILVSMSHLQNLHCTSFGCLPASTNEKSCNLCRYPKPPLQSGALADPHGLLAQPHPANPAIETDCRSRCCCCILALDLHILFRQLESQNSWSRHLLTAESWTGPNSTAHFKQSLSHFVMTFRARCSSKSVSYLGTCVQLERILCPVARCHLFQHP